MPPPKLVFYRPSPQFFCIRFSARIRSRKEKRKGERERTPSPQERGMAKKRTREEEEDVCRKFFPLSLPPSPLPSSIPRRLLLVFVFASLSVSSSSSSGDIPGQIPKLSNTIFSSDILMASIYWQRCLLLPFNVIIRLKRRFFNIPEKRAFLGTPQRWLGTQKRERSYCERSSHQTTTKTRPPTDRDALFFPPLFAPFWNGNHR